MLTSVLTHLDLTAAHSLWGTHILSWCSTCLPNLNRDSSLEELLVRSANVLFVLSPFLFIDKICLWLFFPLASWPYRISPSMFCKNHETNIGKCSFLFPQTVWGSCKYFFLRSFWSPLERWSCCLCAQITHPLLDDCLGMIHTF